MHIYIYRGNGGISAQSFRVFTLMYPNFFFRGISIQCRFSVTLLVFWTLNVVLDVKCKPRATCIHPTMSELIYPTMTEDRRHRTSSSWPWPRSSSISQSPPGPPEGNPAATPSRLSGTSPGSQQTSADPPPPPPSPPPPSPPSQTSPRDRTPPNPTTPSPPLPLLFPSAAATSSSSPSRPS